MCTAMVGLRMGRQSRDDALMMNGVGVLTIYLSRESVGRGSFSTTYSGYDEHDLDERGRCFCHETFR